MAFFGCTLFQTSTMIDGPALRGGLGLCLLLQLFELTALQTHPAEDTAFLANQIQRCIKFCNHTLVKDDLVDAVSCYDHAR